MFVKVLALAKRLGRVLLMSEYEAFHEYGEMVFEPVLERAKSSYFKAADSERTAATRIQAIQTAERELRVALEALGKIKEALT